MGDVIAVFSMILLGGIFGIFLGVDLGLRLAGCSARNWRMNHEDS